tara:strand:- start:24 stop:584 length:561 start_codon:yes stop_codon:yes gene_type:complete
MKNTTHTTLKLLSIALSSSFILSACGGPDVEYNYPRRGAGGVPTYEKEKTGIFGEGGLTIFNSEGSSSDRNSGGSSGIGVNSFLWRASLDTVAFMPLISADPFGGVILTDWYGPPDSVNERYKITLFILGTTLRSDGVRAQVFKQKRSTGKGWKDASPDETLDRDLENAILTRARQLRITSAQKTE